MQVSLDSCIGRKENNVAEIGIGPMIILVYFSNPHTTPVLIELEKIKGDVLSKGITLFEKFHFYNWHLRFSQKDKNQCAELLYKRLDSYDYCADRTLCIVCTGRYFKIIHNLNVETIFTTFCDEDSFASILMGLEYNQEEEYPPNDKFNDEDLLRWLDTLAETMEDLQTMYIESTMEEETIDEQEFEEET